MQVIGINDDEYDLIPYRLIRSGKYIKKKIIPNFGKSINQLVYRYNKRLWIYSAQTVNIKNLCLTMAEARHTSLIKWGAYYV